MLPITPASGRGCTLVASDGAEYLDFTSGISVTNVGHCHPRVVEAVEQQARRLMHTSPLFLAHSAGVDLTEELGRRMPAGLDRFFFANSGAEAVEAAVKVARQATKRPNLIVFEGAFHGRTGQTMAMSSSRAFFRAGHGPLPSSVFVAPYPYWFRTGESPEAACDRCLEALRLIFRTQTAPSETAAVFLEPVLGEGGYVVPPPTFLEGVQAICKENDVLLVCDEVQTGSGRTGRYLALEHYGLEPDIVVMAKALASGLPFGAVAIRQDLDEKWPPFSHGTTFGGNPVACAAAVATLQVLDGESLLDNATARGDQLRARLAELAQRDRCVGDVRGLGLMNAIEIVGPDGAPDLDRTLAIIDHCWREEGVLLITCGTDGNVIRIIPPLIVSPDEIESAVSAIEASLAATS
jgi:4-aminobutyrate aminotransferase